MKIKSLLSSTAFNFYTSVILAPTFLPFIISFFSRLQISTISVFLSRCSHDVLCISVVAPRSFLSLLHHKIHCPIPPPSMRLCSFWMPTLVYWQCGFCCLDNLWILNCPKEGSNFLFPIPLPQRKFICPAVLQSDD